MYRLKTPDSIVEKSKTLRLLNVNEVKSNITDLIGAKIILEDSSQQSVDKIIDRLTDAEKDHKLRIVEIENYRPEPEMNDDNEIVQMYDYASAKALRKLKFECDKKGQSIPKRDEDVPSGYMAIHLLTELPNGFISEIQVMGKNVAELKDIEDLCYKFKNGKTIPGVYNSLGKNLEPLKNKDDILLKREFNKYTRDAYKYERYKELGKNKDKDFLHIPDYLPKQLDFNDIKNTKQKCEKRKG